MAVTYNDMGLWVASKMHDDIERVLIMGGDATAYANQFKKIIGISNQNVEVLTVPSMNQHNYQSPYLPLVCVNQNPTFNIRDYFPNAHSRPEFDRIICTAAPGLLRHTSLAEQLNTWSNGLSSGGRVVLQMYRDLNEETEMVDNYEMTLDKYTKAATSAGFRIENVNGISTNDGMGLFKRDANECVKDMHLTWKKLREAGLPGAHIVLRLARKIAKLAEGDMADTADDVEEYLAEFKVTMYLCLRKV